MSDGPPTAFPEEEILLLVSEFDLVVLGIAPRAIFEKNGSPAIAYEITPRLWAFTNYGYWWSAAKLVERGNVTVH